MLNYLISSNVFDKNYLVSLPCVKVKWSVLSSKVKVAYLLFEDISSKDSFSSLGSAKLSYLPTNIAIGIFAIFFKS